MSFTDICSALLIVFIWGLTFVAIKLGVADAPPLFMSAVRFVFSAFPAVFFLKKPQLPMRYMAGFGLILGVCMFGLINSAIQLGMPTGLTSITIQIQVFVTIIASFFIFQEKPQIWQILGALIGFLGMAVIGVSKSTGVTLVPFLMLIGAGCSWASANIIIKLATRASLTPINMFAFVAWASLFAPLPLFALSWYFEDHHAIMQALSHPTFNMIGSTFYLAFAATVLAYGMWTRLLSRYYSASVTPFALLVPIEGFIAGHLIYNEAFDSLAIIGSVLVFFGLALSALGGRLFAKFLPS